MLGKYLYLYVLIQLQHGALLVGSVGLFVLLAAFMYATRNVDWFEVMSSNDANAANDDNSGEGAPPSARKEAHTQMGRRALPSLPFPYRPTGAVLCEQGRPSFTILLTG